MLRFGLIPLGALALLCACTPEENVGADECGAADYAWLKGKTLAEVTLPEHLNPRIIAPDTMVTRDYLPSRLNIYVTDGGVVTDITCG